MQSPQDSKVEEASLRRVAAAYLEAIDVPPPDLDRILTGAEQAQGHVAAHAHPLWRYGAIPLLAVAVSLVFFLRSSLKPLSAPSALSGHAPAVGPSANAFRLPGGGSPPRTIRWHGHTYDLVEPWHGSVGAPAGTAVSVSVAYPAPTHGTTRFALNTSTAAPVLPLHTFFVYRTGRGGALAHDLLVRVPPISGHGETNKAQRGQFWLARPAPLTPAAPQPKP